jgi:hypothetical protein
VSLDDEADQEVTKRIVIAAPPAVEQP